MKKLLLLVGLVVFLTPTFASGGSYERIYCYNKSEDRAIFNFQKKCPKSYIEIEESEYFPIKLKMDKKKEEEERIKILESEYMVIHCYNDKTKDIINTKQKVKFFTNGVCPMNYYSLSGGQYESLYPTQKKEKGRSYDNYNNWREKCELSLRGKCSEKDYIEGKKKRGRALAMRDTGPCDPKCGGSESQNAQQQQGQQGQGEQAKRKSSDDDWPTFKTGYEAWKEKWGWTQK